MTIARRVGLAGILWLALLGHASAQLTPTILPSTTFPMIGTGAVTTNTAHNAEGDLQQPTAGPYGAAVTIAAKVLVSRTLGGTDHTIANNYEACQFNLGNNAAIGMIAVQLKFSGSPTVQSVLQGYLYTDSGGKPNANITGSGSGQPPQFFLNAANTSTYTTGYFRIAASGLTANTNYWFVLDQAVMSGGSAILNTDTGTATGVYATNNVDSVGSLPSGTTNWSLTNNLNCAIQVYGDTYIAAYGSSDTYRGMQGQSIAGWGLRGDSESGIGIYAKSRHNFGLGASSVFGIAVGGHALYGGGGQFISDTTYGLTAQGVTTGAQMFCTGNGCIGTQSIAGSGGVTWQGLNHLFATTSQISEGGDAFFNAMISSGSSSVLSSATTIAPTNRIHHVSGTTTIQTITVPAGCSPTCEIVLIPDGLWATNTSGNISLGTTAVVNKALHLTWDGTKWNPSY